jgi:hypothetical protein
VLLPGQRAKLVWGTQDKEHAMSSKHNTAIATVIGIDIGKNSFHIVGQGQRGAIVLRQKRSRGQVEAKLAVPFLRDGALLDCRSVFFGQHDGDDALRDGRV